SEKIARLPGANFIVASPPTEWVVVFHLLLLTAFIFFWPSEKPDAPSESWKRRQAIYLKGRKAMGVIGFLFVLVSVVWWIVSVTGPQPLRIIFLAVGHGNAVVVQSPRGPVFVCDGGKETHGPDRYQPLVAYLRHRGISRVEDVLNTHPDEDHVGGLVNLAWATPIRKAFEGFEVVSDSGIYKAFQKTIQLKGIPLTKLKEGDLIEGFEPAKISILHPTVSYHPRIHADNNRSVVSQVSFGAFSLILPGDLEKDGIQKLLKDHQPFPKVDWLMAPHHGRSSGEPALCAQGLRPHFVVLSDWKDYPEDHKLYQAVVPDAVVLSTAEEGAIEVEVNAQGKGRYRSFLKGEWQNFDGK
ncbi:MAG TPA: MBL fold metallo-hydrolase, partial [bacterium]